MNKQRNRWIIFVAAWINVGATGATFFWSIFNKPLMEVHPDWDPASVVFTYSLLLILVGVFGLVSGKLTERFPANRIMLVGVLMWSIGWIIVGFTDSLVGLYLAFGIMAGLGDGLIYNQCVGNTVKWFPDKKGLASGLLLGAPAIMPLFLAPVANMLITSFGVHQCFIIIGVAFLVVQGATFWLIQTPPKDYKPSGWEPSSVTVAAVSSTDLRWREMLKLPEFYLLFIAFVLGVTSSMIMVGHGSGIGQELAGLDTGQAALMVGILAVSNFCGRFFCGIISDKVGRYPTLLACIVLIFVVVMFMPYATTFPLFMVAIIGAGFALGGHMVSYPAICSERFGITHVNLNYGILFLAFTVGGYIGPKLGSQALMDYGTYLPAFGWCAIISVAAFVTFVIYLIYIKMKDKKANSESA